MQTFPKGLRAFPLFSAYPFLRWTILGTAGKGSACGLHSMPDHYKERTQGGCGIFKDPLTAGVCNTEAELCSFTIYDIMQPQ